MAKEDKDKEDILAKARAALGPAQPTASEQPKAYLPDGRAMEAAKAILDRKFGLDTYLVFDTTGSMAQYISIVRADLRHLTGELLKEGEHFRLSMNGIGDHCDGKDWLQMYPVTANPDEVRGSIDSIVMTDGGDAPEAYECLALALAQRIPKDSAGRKRAVVLIADSVPHGMMDGECPKAGSYERAFTALKTLCDGFYFVGCNRQMYSYQEQLIDPARKEREQFIPLGELRDVLPQLLVALAKKTESEKALHDYLGRLELQDQDKAGKVRGLLTAGR